MMDDTDSGKALLMLFLYPIVYCLGTFLVCKIVDFSLLTTTIVCHD